MGRPCAAGFPGADGSLCPRYENDPHTAEGRAALHLALSPGIWRRAGMSGVMCGIDWTAAKVLAEGVAEGGPWPAIARLLTQFELGALKGEARRIKDKQEQQDS
jgi:hypothetical protein